MSGALMVIELAALCYLMFSVWGTTRENLTRYQHDRRNRRSADAAPKDREEKRASS